MEIQQRASSTARHSQTTSRQVHPANTWPSFAETTSYDSASPISIHQWPQLPVASWQGAHSPKKKTFRLLVGKFSPKNTQFGAGNPPMLGELRGKLELFWASVSPLSEICSCPSENCNFLPPPKLFNPGCCRPQIWHRYILLFGCVLFRSHCCSIQFCIKL